MPIDANTYIGTYISSHIHTSMLCHVGRLTRDVKMNTKLDITP